MSNTWNQALLKVRELLRDRNRFRGSPDRSTAQLEDALLAARFQSQKVVFLAHWGLWANTQFADKDRKVLESLVSLVNALADSVGVSGGLVLLLTDTHAHVNQVAESDYRCYAAAVEAEAADLRVSSQRMSQLFAQVGIGSLTEAVLQSRAYDSEWADLSSYVHDEMCRRAKRCALSGLPSEAALRYFSISRLEGVLLRARYPEAIIISYHTPNFWFLLPALPTVFLRFPGAPDARRPWFQSNDQNPS